MEPRGRYPREVERRMTSRSGHEYLLRPLRPTDERKLTELFYSVSENSLYRRFLRATKHVAHSERQYYLDVDYQHNTALVVETCEPRQEPEIVAVAQYFQHPKSGFADVAFLVRDALQGQGLGTELVRALIDRARECGVKGFTADVLTTNQHMLHLFNKSGLEVSSKADGEVLRLTMPFDGAKPTQ
jgi:RimJ/RimL family protein N-acetyltransferase